MIQGLKDIVGFNFAEGDGKVLPDPLSGAPESAEQGLEPLLDFAPLPGGADVVSVLQSETGVDVISRSAPVNEAPQVAFAPNPVGSPDLTGDNGRDGIEGDEKDNLIRGRGGDDVLLGRDGRDLIYGGAGDDRINGGTGSDTLYGGAGNDSIGGFRGRDEIHGGAGDDTLNGGAGQDVIYAGSGKDLLIGSFSKDALFGGAGADRLVGGAGADQLKGGGGNDLLIGGQGRDTFIFTLRFGKDRILDFEVDKDMLDFSGHASVSGVADLTFTQGDRGLVIADVIGSEVTINGFDLAQAGEISFIF